VGWGGYGEGGGGGGEGVWGVMVRGMDDMMQWQWACARWVWCLFINGSGFERYIIISGAPSSIPDDIGRARTTQHLAPHPLERRVMTPSALLMLPRSALVKLVPFTTNTSRYPPPLRRTEDTRNHVDPSPSPDQSSKIGLPNIRPLDEPLDTSPLHRLRTCAVERTSDTDVHPAGGADHAL